MSTPVSEVTRAACFARIMHEGQKYGPRPYFEGHILRVTDRIAADPKATYGDMVVGYLHDVVEDTHVRLVDLLVLGFSKGIVDSVDAITRRQHESYMDYVKRAGQDSIGCFVKWHDLQENFDNCRAFGEKKAGLAKRYQRAIEYLSQHGTRIGS